MCLLRGKSCIFNLMVAIHLYYISSINKYTGIYGYMFCMLLFNFVIYVLLCLRILIVIYVPFRVFCFIV
jgi:hypothetical protein